MGDLRSGCARENALQGDTEIDRQKRLHVQMGLASADIANSGRIHGAKRAAAGIGLRQRAGEKITRRQDSVRVVCDRGSVCQMQMLRYFADGQRMRLLTPALAQSVAVADVNRRAAAQVRKSEVDPPVAAECRSE